MKMIGTLADCVCVQATSRFVKRDVIVINNSDNTGYIKITFKFDAADTNQPPMADCILLGHFDNNFVS